ncbi:MAG: anthranilate synthase component I [bacterium]
MILAPLMTFDAFTQAARIGNVVPLSASVAADTVTPVSAFLRLAANATHSFLLESVEGGEKLARFSFLGFDPRWHVNYRRPTLEIVRNGERKTLTQDIFSYLQNERKQFRLGSKERLPRFAGGLVGYFGYDAARDLERLPEREASAHAHAGVPAPLDAAFGLYDTILAFDHPRQQIWLITNVFIDEGELNLKRRYEEAVEKLAGLERHLRQFTGTADPPTPAGPAEPRYHWTREQYTAAVLRAKEYIAAGDILQAVLSQRFHGPLRVDPFQIYRALRLINPSPYLYFFKHGEVCLIGSSPEMLLRVENRLAQVRPIAGTRRRGVHAAEDEALERELQADAKERAEHLMLVDLGRNDLGRVCEYGSVQVDTLMATERYSHVMHLVSNVQGKLREGRDAIDALRACFPAGTVSGAPKIRAMEIIDELEPEHRGPYAGAVGYLDFSGNLDTCITIRTIWTHGDKAYFQAGAGIVADSDPGKEYQETIEKARAMWSAIDLAERGL